MVFEDTEVNLKSSKVNCNKQKNKNTKVEDYKIKSENSENIFTISMTVKKTGKAILQEASLQLGTTSTTTTTDQSTTTSSNKDCELGYSLVCTQGSGEDRNLDEMSSVCPAFNETNAKVLESQGCSCLPTIIVEQGMALGVSPLGSKHQDCVKVPSHLFTDDTPDVVNITTMMSKWNIESVISTLTGSPDQQDELMKALEKAMKEEMKHEMAFSGVKKSSGKFIRSTKLTQEVHKNYKEMKCMQMAIKNVTSSWPASRQTSNNVFEDTCQMLTDNLMNTAECNSSYVCNEANPYRSITGCCNNIGNKTLGSANRAFDRFLPSAYEDGVSLPRGGLTNSNLPSARKVSSAVHRQKELGGQHAVSLMVMQFAQFLDHDLTLTPEEDFECCDSDVLLKDIQNDDSSTIPEEMRFCFNIDARDDSFYMDKASCLPFTRSNAICTPQENSKREQINALNSYVDASNLYGVSEERAKALRTNFDGRMKTNEIGPTLPTRKEVNFESNDPHHPEDLVAGDIRAIEQPGLASMHSLFLNEHNRIAQALKEKRPHLSDETLYQITRKVVGAEMQNIVYSEFLPVVLGNETVVKYNLKLPELESGETVYDPEVSPVIRNEFATVAFRFGHSLIPNQILPALKPIRTQSNSCPLRDNFFKFDEFILGSDLSGEAWKNMIRGITSQESPGMDASMNRNILDFLFCGENCAIPGGFGQDLAARNIQRGRDHGMPSYTKFREFCGLSSLTDWTNKPEEITQQDWENLKDVYSNVEDIDPFVGGVAEIGPEDGLVGPTFGCIIGKQFESLMTGDRFFFSHPVQGPNFEKGLPLQTKISIRRRTLGDIVCDNTEASSIAQKVFRISSDTGAMNCSGREGLDFDAIVEEFDPTATTTTTTTPTTTTTTTTTSTTTGKGILVSGGAGTDTSVEVFLPDSGDNCSLPSLPDARYFHSMDTLANTPVICGGENTATSCIHLTPTSASGVWTNHATLEESRQDHTSWVSSAGLVIMGGAYSDTTTEIAGAGANISLAQRTRFACGITDKDSIIITGGVITLRVVARYNLQGHVEDLPQMTQERQRHGCGSFYTGNKMVLVVAGGSDGGPLSSTEQLTIGAATWTTVKPLPRTLYWVASVSMNNKIYLLGGYDGDKARADILEWDGEDWKEVGQLQKGRWAHAATVIAMDNLGVCN